MAAVTLVKAMALLSAVNLLGPAQLQGEQFEFLSVQLHGVPTPQVVLLDQSEMEDSAGHRVWINPIAGVALHGSNVLDVAFAPEALKSRPPSLMHQRILGMSKGFL